MSPDPSYLTPTVKFEGRALAADVELLDLRIDLGLNVVGRATFHFAGSLSDVGSSVTKLGNKVEVNAPGGNGVFVGTVTGIEVDRSATGDHITTVTALDGLHQLSGRSRV